MKKKANSEWHVESRDPFSVIISFINYKSHFTIFVGCLSRLYQSEKVKEKFLLTHVEESCIKYQISSCFFLANNVPLPFIHYKLHAHKLGEAESIKMFTETSMFLMISGYLKRTSFIILHISPASGVFHDTFLHRHKM